MKKSCMKKSCMKKSKIVFIGLLGILLVFGMIFTGCPSGKGGGGDDDDDEYIIGPTPPLPPLLTSEFTITHNPASRLYTLDDTIEPLTVAVSIESDEFAYKWYINTTFTASGQITLPPVDATGGWSEIPDALEDSYTPADLEVGDYFYYCKVIHPRLTVASRPALIKITDSASAEPPTVFQIDNKKYNYVRGVGGTGAFMFRDGSGAGASPDVDVEYIDQLMGPDGVGANILRVMVQDDFKNYLAGRIQSQNVDEHPHDAPKNFYNVIKRVNQYGGYVFANAWTAPGSMKTNNRPMGGPNATLKSGYDVAYANHFRDYLKTLNANGAPIYAVGILNEPDYGGSANYEGMEMNGNNMRDFWRYAGHFTTQRVTNPDTYSSFEDVEYEEDIIPGYGGGKPTHHVLTMNGDGMGNEGTLHTPSLQNPVANQRVEIFGRHFYGGQARYTSIAGSEGIEWSNRPTSWGTGANASSFNNGTTYPELFVEGKREVWMTEFDQGIANPVVGTWPRVFPVMNMVDHSLRVNDESAFSYWYSQCEAGLVSSITEAGWRKGEITTRGKAFAHFARYVKETWRVGVTRTSSNSWAYNPNSYGLDNTAVKVSAYLDAKEGKFLSVILYTPNDAANANAVNVGQVQINLPDGLTASTVHALKSFGRENGEYWLDDVVFLSADGKSATINLPAQTIISVRFMLQTD